MREREASKISMALSYVLTKMKIIVISAKKSDKINQHTVIPRAVLSAIEKYKARFLP